VNNLATFLRAWIRRLWIKYNEWRLQRALRVIIDAMGQLGDAANVAAWAVRGLADARRRTNRWEHWTQRYRWGEID
jgi:hypothetical protein